jgi:hypothetical protein
MMRSATNTNITISILFSVLESSVIDALMDRMIRFINIAATMNMVSERVVWCNSDMMCL